MAVRCALLLLASACGRDATPSTLQTIEALASEAAVPKPPCPTDPTALGPGLTAERQQILGTPAAGDPACIDVVRADPARYRLRVLSASIEGRSQPAPAWREAFRLVAVTNAGMFHADGAPVGMIVQDGSQLRGDNKTFHGYLAFDPVSPDDVPVVIAGRDCAGFDLAALRTRYRSIVQSGRLLGCKGEALPWKDPKQYSAAAIAVDRDGRIVFLHARAAVTMTELAVSLAALDLAGALFLEGGPEASLVVRGDDGQLSRVGSYETNFVENDSNHSFWWLPNVLALEQR